MLSSIKRALPEFIEQHQLIYCDNLIYAKRKSCLVLTKNLQFYEFSNKQLLMSFDLSATCIAKVRHKLLQHKGLKGKCLKNTQSEINTCFEPDMLEISFGKYIHRNLETIKLYILLRCWDKLVILERLAKSFELTAEYEDVVNYKIVHGTTKYHALVDLQLRSGVKICTDFQNNPTPFKEQCPSTAMSKNDFRELVKRINSSQNELQVIQAMTQKDFERYRDTQNFGCNFVRTLRLEEKHMLARCGDVWMRLTHESCVIGVPLVNNCAPPNLTVIQRLRPVLKINAESTKGLSYHYKLYDLKQTFEDIESVETFFQTEEPQLIPDTFTPNTQHKIFPRSFAVLLLRVEFSQLVSLGACPLFLIYELDKNWKNFDGSMDKRNFQLQLFIKDIDFDEIISKRHKHLIDFSEKTLHQDFLAISHSAIENRFKFHFARSEDVRKFEQLMTKTFEFHREGRHTNNDRHFNGDTSENEEAPETNLKHLVFYNKNPASLWFSFLVLRVTKQGEEDDDKELNHSWKFYTRGEEKTFLFFKMLFDDLLMCGCNVREVVFQTDQVFIPPRRSSPDIPPFDNN